MKNKKLARIHILKNQLGLSDEVYRNMLHSNYKVSSPKDLTLTQQNKLITSLTQQVPKTDKLSSAQYSKIISCTISNINTLTKKEASSVINPLRRHEKSKMKRTPLWNYYILYEQLVIVKKSF